ncbi:uncharacterized protein [Typha latifolia]|uniref:uncharacterized protein n=1 Tax=Typha latifolia TaxID=4733 RepID=UPI003C2E9167
MSSTSPCAACKFLRRKCTQGCVFSPYFPPDQPTKFANVHRVFGASNVAKLLNELNPAQREDAVNSLAYEAEARLRDPVYGCVSYISFLQSKVKQIQHDLCNAKKELATYIGPAAFGNMVSHQMFASQAHQFQGGSANSSVSPSSYGVPGIGIGIGVGVGVAPQSHAQMLAREQQQQQQVMEFMAREHEILRGYEQQQQQELARLNSGYDGRGYNAQLGGGTTVAVVAGQPTGVTLVSPQTYESGFPVTHHQQPKPQPPSQQQRAGSDEGRSSGLGPPPS